MTGGSGAPGAQALHRPADRRLDRRSVALSFLSGYSRYFSAIFAIFLAVFRRFSAPDPELDRPVCVSVSFFRPERPNPAESLGNAIRDGSKNDSGRKCFHPAPGGGPRPTRPPPPLPSFRPEPRRKPGRSGNPASAPPENSGDAAGSGVRPASVASRISPLRLRSEPALSEVEGAGCYAADAASVEMTVGRSALRLERRSKECDSAGPGDRSPAATPDGGAGGTLRALTTHI